MAISGAVIWFLGVFIVALVITLAVVLLERRVKLRVNAAGASPSTSPTTKFPWISKLGLVFSMIGLIIAIYLIPVAKLLPDTLGVPIFIYSFMAFPFFIALGLTLSVIGYFFNRDRASLIPAAISGVALVWLVATFVFASTTGCGGAKVEVNGTVQSMSSDSIVVDGQTIVISPGLLPLQREVIPGAQVHLFVHKNLNGSLTACGVGVNNASSSSGEEEVFQAGR